MNAIVIAVFAGPAVRVNARAANGAARYATVSRPVVFVTRLVSAGRAALAGASAVNGQGRYATAHQ